MATASVGNERVAHSQSELDEVRALLAAQLELSASGILVVDRAGGVLSYNDRFLELWSIPRELGATADDDKLLGYVRAQLKDWDGFLSLVRHLYDHPDEERHGDFIELRTGRTLSRSTRPVVLADGTIIGRAWDFTDVTQLVRDLSEQQRYQEKLRESEEHLRMIIESEPECVKMVSRSGEVLEMNPAGLAMVEAGSLEELRGMEVFELAVPECRAAFRELHEQVFEGQSGILEFEIEGLLGTRRWMETHAVPLRGPSGEVTAHLAVTRDITERKRAEEEHRQLESKIRETQKLESLGLLAGGIAHDFNNILVGILGNAGLALETDPPAECRELLEEVEKAAQRAAELAGQMLAYSGKGRFLIEVIDLNELVADMIHLLEVSISKKATLRFDPARGIPAFEGDATQIRQVVMNLITNASDALGEGDGTITVRTGLVHVDRATLDTTTLAEELDEGSYLYLEVADTGCGMDEEAREKIFDPFFTTKATGRGLGMAALFGIVRGHHGGIRVDSQTGKGSVIRVLLPPSDRAHRVRRPGHATDEPWHSTGTVLVVDDEQLVRAFACEALERIGFSVLAAVDGRSAIELFRTHADDIDAVLLDMSMPHLSGPETAHELRRLRGDVVIIFTSGFSQQDAKPLLGDEASIFFLEKPYRPRDLRAKLREALGSLNTPARAQDQRP